MTQKYKYFKGDMVLYKDPKWMNYQLAEIVDYKVDHPEFDKRVTLVTQDQMVLSQTNKKIIPTLIQCNPKQVSPENKHQPLDLGQRVLVCPEDKNQIDLIRLHGDIPCLPLHHLGQTIEIMELKGVLKKVEVIENGFIYTIALKDNPYFKIKANYCPEWGIFLGFSLILPFA